MSTIRPLRLLSVFLSVLVSLVALAPYRLNGEEEQPTAEQIQQFLRLSYTLQEGELTGKLRSADRDIEVPFRLSMHDNSVRFRFDSPIQIITLDLEARGSELREIVRGQNGPVDPARYGQKIRGTDITYEDLGMRFLHWPNAKIIDEDRILHQACWILRVFNPGEFGPYKAVDVWVGKKSGAVMKMNGYDRVGGKLIKQFQVRSAQKVSGQGYILEKMLIETFDPSDARFPIGRTYLEIDKPKSIK